MSRSIHITIRNFKRLSKKEIDEQAGDPHSDLNEWAKKKSVKKEILKNRRNKGQQGIKNKSVALKQHVWALAVSLLKPLLVFRALALLYVFTNNRSVALK